MTTNLVEFSISRIYDYFNRHQVSLYFLDWSHTASCAQFPRTQLLEDHPSSPLEKAREERRRRDSTYYAASYKNIVELQVKED